MPSILRVSVIAGSLAVLGSFILIGLLISSSTPDIARAELDRNNHNWGRVAPGTELSTTFFIRNSGGQPLILGDPQATCGCMKPVLPTSSIPPGDQVQLEVKVHVPDKTGKIRHEIAVPTNDPDQPQLVMYVWAEAWTGIACNPQSVHLGTIKPGETVRRSIQLISPDREPFQLVHAASNCADMVISLNDSSTLSPIHRVDLAYTAGAHIGEIDGIVQVSIDHPSTSSVEIPLTGHVSGTATTKPTRLWIDRADIGTIVPRSIVISSVNDDVRFGIREAWADEPWKLVDITHQQTNRNSIIIDVELYFPRGSGGSGHALWLRLDDAQSTVCRIPLEINGWSPPPPVSMTSEPAR